MLEHGRVEPDGLVGPGLQCHLVLGAEQPIEHRQQRREDLAGLERRGLGPAIGHEAQQLSGELGAPHGSGLDLGDSGLILLAQRVSQQIGRADDDGEPRC